MPDPLLLPPVTRQQWKNRFDDSRRRKRTLYGGGSRLTCLFERLASFRPDVGVIAQLDQIHSEDDDSERGIKLEYGKLIADIGLIGADFFERNAFAEFSPAEGQRWLDVREPETIARLRAELAGWLMEHECQDLDFSDLVARDRKLTQFIATLAIDAGAQGVWYYSRLHPGKTCVALFEGARLRPSAITIPITPDDLEFERVADAYQLRLPANIKPPRVVAAQPLSTGGLVQGAGEEANVGFGHMER